VPPETSIAEWIASQPESESTRLLTELAPTPTDQAALAYCWPFWARPSQMEPGPDRWRDGKRWTKWLVLAGRGFGKTRTGAEWVISRVRDHIEGDTTDVLRIALVGQTPADVRDVMVEGESGILACCPAWMAPEWNRSSGELVWRDMRGEVIVRAKAYSGHNPGKLRGPQHHLAWADEMAAWKYPETWDQLMFGLRLGDHPQVVITTTPRPVRTVRNLLKDQKCIVTRGSTHDNAANLPDTFIDEILSKYEGTTLGQQEIYAQLLDENPGALWTRALIAELRIALADVPELVRIVVAIDPAVSSKSTSDETGIVVAGLAANGHAYVLADGSKRQSTQSWARTAIAQFRSYEADRIIGEANNGGDLVADVIRSQDDRVPVKLVHASRGKYARAEPVAALYEQRKIHHVGTFDDLEDQMCNWTVDVDWSPDRMDALVWALSELMLGPKGKASTAPNPMAGGGGEDERDENGRRKRRAERGVARRTTPGARRQREGPSGRRTRWHQRMRSGSSSRPSRRSWASSTRATSPRRSSPSWSKLLAGPPCSKPLARPSRPLPMIRRPLMVRPRSTARERRRPLVR
jgi:phage terminase large subunit-like protein